MSPLKRSQTRSRGVRPHSGVKGLWAGAVLWVVLGVWTALWAWLRWTPSGISWHFFPEGAHLLFGTDGLRLYARHPELQIGPLTFALVEPLTALPAAAALAVAQILMTGAGVLALWLIAPLAARDAADVEPRGGPARSRADQRVLLAGLVLLPFWTVLSVRWAHPDDVLAMLFAAVAVRAVHGGRGAVAGLGLGAAIAAKPWAIGFTPMLLALPASALGRAVVVLGLAAAAGWAPFVLADSATVTALHPPVLIADTSVLRLVGIRDQTVPGWTRTAQLLLAPAVAVVAVLRRRWPAVPLVAIAVRLALDPQDIGYYTAAAVLAAALADLACTERLVPWATIATALAWWHPFVEDFATRFSTAHGVGLWWFQHPSAVAAVHLVWALGVLALLFVPGARDREPGRADRSLAPA